MTPINKVSAKLLTLVRQGLAFNFITYMLVIIIILPVLSMSPLFVSVQFEPHLKPKRCIERPYFFGSQSRRMC